MRVHRRAVEDARKALEPLKGLMERLEQDKMSEAEFTELLESTGRALVSIAARLTNHKHVFSYESRDQLNEFIKTQKAASDRLKRD